MDFNLSTTLPALVPACKSWLDWDGRTWDLTSAFAAEWDYLGKRYTLTVAPGFQTDGGSVPRFFWRFVGHPLDRWLVAYLIHDALYSSEYITRKLADQIFERMLEYLGASWIVRKSEYLAVRVAGKYVWLDHTPQQIAIDRDLIKLKISTI